MKTGVLLVNLGSTVRPDASAVRSFLREFLSDPRVIDLPALGRFLLLNLIILPFRPRKTADAYRKIWTPRGSAILFHTEDLRKVVTERLEATTPGKYHVETAMRYGEPFLRTAMRNLWKAGVTRTIVIPLYPQYSAAANASTIAEVYKIACETWDVDAFDVVRSFHDHPGFIKSFAAVLKEKIAEEGKVDHVLFSFHGLPERQIKKSDLSAGCLKSQDCCDRPGDRLASCYRAQCFDSARRIQEEAGLDAAWSVAFQSRLGRDPWITPHTDVVLVKLAKQGVKSIAVTCPSFTADCLETLEEIGIRGKEAFLSAGGSKLVFVPSLNSRSDWAEALVAMIQERKRFE